MSRSPKDCANMAELRQEIDALDVQLVALFARRAGYIDRAIELKQIENLPARVTDRVEEVVANVKRLARDQSLDDALVEDLWRQLIEWSIERESRTLGR